jgi:hypothetical protein
LFGFNNINYLTLEMRSGNSAKVDPWKQVKNRIIENSIGLKPESADPFSTDGPEPVEDKIRLLIIVITSRPAGIDIKSEICPYPTVGGKNRIPLIPIQEYSGSTDRAFQFQGADKIRQVSLIPGLYFGFSITILYTCIHSLLRYLF